MKKQKIEGTFYLEGLLEGPLPGGNETESGIIEWNELTRQVGLPLSTEIDNGRFSILADPIVLESLNFQPSPQESIRLALQKLIELFPPEYVGRLVSTIRIIEYIPGEEIQGLFVVTPDGRIDYQHRRQECQTVKPADPLTPKEIIKIACAALILLVAMLGISTFFIDYKQVWADVRESFTPISTDNMVIDFGPFGNYYQIGEVKYDAKKRQVLCTVIPMASLPTSDKDMEKRWKAADSLKETLTLQAIAKGYAMCEFYNDKGKYIGCCKVKLPEPSEQMLMTIPLPKENRPTKLKLTWPA